MRHYYSIEAARLGLMIFMVAAVAISAYTASVAVGNQNELVTLSTKFDVAVKSRDERFDQLEQRMLGSTSDRYRGDQARRDFAGRDAKLAEMERRLSRIEAGVSRIEHTLFGPAGRPK